MATKNTVETRLEEIVACERELRPEESFATGSGNFARLRQMLTHCESASAIIKRRVLQALERMGSACRPALFETIANGTPQATDAAILMLGWLVTANLLHDWRARPVDQRERLVAQWERRVVEFEWNFLPKKVERQNAQTKIQASPFDPIHEEQVFGELNYCSAAEFQTDGIARALASAIAALGTKVEPRDRLLPYAVADFLAAAETRWQHALAGRLECAARWQAIGQTLRREGNRLRIEPGLLELTGEATPGNTPWDTNPMRKAGTFGDPGISAGVSLDDEAALGGWLSQLMSQRAKPLWKWNLLSFDTALAAERIVSAARDAAPWRSLSRGAQAALRICAYGLVAEGQPMAAAQEFWNAELNVIAIEERTSRGVFSSLGIELQSESIAAVETYSWKQALEYFGIRSPRRVEFGRLVEAAFPPAFSARAYRCAVPALIALGFHRRYRRGSALHLSVSGDLGPEAKYIAMLLRHFTRREVDAPDRTRWHLRLRRVMSKGLIHRNQQCESVVPGSPCPEVRTEFRVTMLQNTTLDSGQLDPAYQRFLPAVQHLASACLAFARSTVGAATLLDRELALHWQSYRSSVEALYGDHRFCAAGLLDADWFQSTGDRRDPKLVAELDLIQQVEILRDHLVLHPQLEIELAERARAIFWAAPPQSKMPRYVVLDGSPGSPERERHTQPRLPVHSQHIALGRTEEPAASALPLTEARKRDFSRKPAAAQLDALTGGFGYNSIPLEITLFSCVSEDMAKHQDIDQLLRNWSYEPGEVLARLVRAADGREVLQMRVELGVLQLEVQHRPDGTRPGGAETYYDFLVALAVNHGDGFVLSEEQQTEVDREFLQFYQRRICWLALRKFDRAVRDADHNLSLLSFIKSCSPTEEWYLAHEQYRPFILFHRTQAAALASLEARGPEEAIKELNQGLDRMKEFFEEHEADDHFADDEMVGRLVHLRDALRKEYHVDRTLEERLADAVANEQYELAAKLRDEIHRREHGGI